MARLAPEQQDEQVNSGYDPASVLRPIARSDNTLPLSVRFKRARERGQLSFFFRPQRRDQHLPMVGWFDPVQLIETGMKTLVSTLVSARSDQRAIQALVKPQIDIFDYTCHYADTEHGPKPRPKTAREELWIDYVCDTGDGWNPTYAVAHAVAQPLLTLNDGSVLPRGDVLVFGGDEVYPTPSREEYNRRLIAPYSAAFGDQDPTESPHVFAIPGNHDWYDGLSAFSRLFCSDVGGRWFAGWYTRQNRSYFALKLPYGWWLIGSDSQLQSDIDPAQITYFREVAEKHMQRGDRVIGCFSQPFWTFAHKYRQSGGDYDETDLLYLREQVFAPRGVTIQAYLAGDLHHYRRHEETGTAPADAMQKITAGGGGAFLHPTHDDDVSIITESENEAGGKPRSFVLRAEYPDARTSNRLAWGNLFFFWKNPKFGMVPAVLYLLTVWLVGAALSGQRPTGVLDALHMTLEAFRLNPGLTIWMLALIVIFVVFTNSRLRIYRWIGGFLHFLAHWNAIFLIGLVSGVMSQAVVPHGWEVMDFFVQAIIVFVGGWLLGSLIMGLYLLVSLNIFGRHSEEAFSSMKIEDYKHFLRLHISGDGTLTIYPIAIGHTPRRWRDRKPGEEGVSRVLPNEPFTPGLIEPPIVLAAPTGHAKTTKSNGRSSSR